MSRNLARQGGVIGRGATSPALGANDPRTRRTQQNEQTRFTLGASLDLDENRRLIVKPVRRINDATAATLVASFNDLLASLRAGGLMEK